MYMALHIEVKFMRYSDGPTTAVIEHRAGSSIVICRSDGYPDVDYQLTVESTASTSVHRSQTIDLCYVLTDGVSTVSNWTVFCTATRHQYVVNVSLIIETDAVVCVGSAMSSNFGMGKKTN